PSRGTAAFRLERFYAHCPRRSRLHRAKRSHLSLASDGAAAVVAPSSRLSNRKPAFSRVAARETNPAGPGLTSLLLLVPPPASNCRTPRCPGRLSPFFFRGFGFLNLNLHFFKINLKENRNQWQKR